MFRRDQTHDDRERRFIPFVGENESDETNGDEDAYVLAESDAETDIGPTGQMDSSASGWHRSGARAAEVSASILACDATWTGTLTSDGPIEIYGELNGEIVAAHDVLVASGASVTARLQAINLTVAGRLQGSIACTNKFEVLASGVVEGNILAPAIVVHDGAVITGELRMRGDFELPDDETE